MTSRSRFTLGLHAAYRHIDIFIQPPSPHLVVFGLEKLPLARLLGRRLIGSDNTAEVLIQLFETEIHIQQQLAAQLENAWARQGLDAGATLLYPWPDVRATLSEVHNSSAESLEDAIQGLPADYVEFFQAHATFSMRTKVTCIRSLDPLLALNVLCRAHSNILLANAPLNFDYAHLGRTLVADDLRLVMLARDSRHTTEWEMK